MFKLKRKKSDESPPSMIPSPVVVSTFRDPAKEAEESLSEFTEVEARKTGLTRRQIKRIDNLGRSKLFIFATIAVLLLLLAGVTRTVGRSMIQTKLVKPPQVSWAMVDIPSERNYFISQCADNVVIIEGSCGCIFDTMIRDRSAEWYAYKEVKTMRQGLWKQGLACTLFQ